jgi:hypothetical protein
MRQEANILLSSSEQNWEARRESVEYQLGRLVAGQPALLIDPGCHRLINGFLGGYCYKEVGNTGTYQDKPDKNKYSHCHDALQYMLVMLLRNVRVKLPHERGRSRQSYGFTNITDRYRPEKAGQTEYYANV